MNIWQDIKMSYRYGDNVQKLIYWNVALFAIPFVLNGILSLFSLSFDITHYFSLNSNPVHLLWKPWSLVTYAFFHAGFFHILFNLIVLHFIGRLFITFFTQKQLLSVYLLGAVFGGLVFIASYAVFPRLSGISAPMVGASAAVMALLFGVTSYAPHMHVRLLLIGFVKLWQIALVFFVLDLINLAGGNVGGHLAHIGGALFGVFFGIQIKKGSDITKWLTDFFPAISGLFKPKQKNPFKKVHKNERRNSSYQSSVSKTKQQQQIDEILDKISRSGYDSLSKEEKEFLFKVGKE